MEKNLINKVAVGLCLLLMVTIFSSCENMLNKGVMTVEGVQISVSSKECKYYIKTTEYNFYTDSLFSVGDTLYVYR